MPARDIGKRIGKIGRTGQSETDAQTIALRGLAFLVGEPAHLKRFLDETGLSPNDIRRNPQAPEVLEATLSVLVHDEPLLLVFAANAGLGPEDVIEAHATLAADPGH